MTTHSADLSQSYDRPARKTFTGAGIAAMLAVLAVGAFLLWQFGVIKPKPKIALITSGDTPYWDTVIAGANEAGRVYEVDVEVMRLKTDEAAQTQAIRNLLGQRFDGVAISPINPATQRPLLDEVASKTPLVTLDSDSDVTMKLCFVGTNNYYAGRLAGQNVKRALPDGGEVIICVGNIEKENTQHRRQGLIDELLDREDVPNRPMDAVDAPLKGEKYTVAATLVDHSDPAQAEQLAAAALKQHPNVKCFVGLLAYTTPALLKSLQAENKLGQVKVVGFDAHDETLAGIEAGHVEATILQDQYGFGFHAVRILAENARGDASGLPVFQQRTLPCEQVTKENVANVRAQLSKLAVNTANRIGS